MRVALLGVLSVSGPGGVVSGQALGGRRVHVALTALALLGQPVPMDRLASIVWSGSPPPTWPVALRGVIRSLRTSVAGIGPAEQSLVVTTPSGYALAAGIEVDVLAAAESVRDGERLLGQERFTAALAAVHEASTMDGSALLPGADLDWLDPYRQAVNRTRQRALEIVADAAGAVGEHQRAVDAARRAVDGDPLDERAYRALIRALDRAGDRAGAVGAYERCRSVLAEQLGVDPSRDTTDVYLAALRDQSAGSPGRLPVRSAGFVGRTAESALLADAVGRPGLVSVTGRGGVGKSRLALHVASTATTFDGGRFWVPLGPVVRDELVASSVALALGVNLSGGDPLDAITAHLAPLGTTLLVLDGCEAAVDGVASLVAGLLADAPTLTVLATSRLPLGIDDERVVALAPLELPDGTDRAALAASVPVRLLVDRVRAGGGTLTLDERSAPLVAELCRRCGGLPLALELVAAQLTAMPVGDLLDHLAEVSGSEDDQLRAVVRHSHALLDPDEAVVFRRLAVLDGPVGLPLIRQVVAGPDVAPLRVVRILRELTARGLLTVDRSGPRWRYQQDDDLRRFALELLADADEQESVFRRLADAVVAMLPADPKAPPSGFAERVTEELGSVRSLLGAALDGRVARDHGLEVAFRLHRYWAATTVAEGRFWLSRLLTDAPDSTWNAHASYALGYLSYWLGDAEAAVRELEVAARRLRGTADDYAARALMYLAGLADDLDRGADAVDFVRMAIDAARPYGVDLQVGAAMGMGCVLAERSDPSAADFAEEAIELCRQGGSAEQLAVALPTAAMVCWQVGDLDRARAYIAEARPMHAGTRRIARVVLLSASAGVALADGDVAAALDFGRDADREASELGVEREVPLVRSVLALALLAVGDVVGAADRAAAAIDAAGALTFDSPLAVGLETAVIVLRAAGGADRVDLARLLDVAARLRARGDRPTVAPLRADVLAARAAVGTAAVGTDSGAEIDVPAAVALAGSLLTAVRDRR